MKKVSIAIALYNNAPHIERCLQSVIEQKYSNLEIIVVDDGSKDDSLLKCEKFKTDPRVKVVTKVNGGLSSVRQMGLEMATGYYICFIDADDYLLNTHVESMVLNMETSGADICLSTVRFEDEKGRTINNGVFNENTSIVAEKVSIDRIANSYNVIRHQYKLSDSWNKMYKLRFLRETEVRFELPKGYNGSDKAFNHKIILHQPLVSSVRNSGYIHVIYKNSAVHRKNRKIYEGSMLQFDQIFKEIRKIGLENEMKIQLNCLFIQFIQDGMMDIAAENGLFSLEIRQCFIDSKKRKRSLGLNINPFVLIEKGIIIFAFLYLYVPCLLPFYLLIRDLRYKKITKC